MSDNYDEILENEIGNAGAVDATPRPLGRLEHADQILGHKEQLNDDEKSQRDDFLSRSRRERESRREAAQANISDGWIPVDRSEMGVRSKFYPPEWEFYVKAAPVMAIKNWTAIDEERADQVNTTLNEICRTSVKIVTNGVGQAGWGAINSWDRFWFILKVREVTFLNGETKIQFEDACSECDHDIQYTLTSDALFYEFPDDELIDKYWNGKTWDIDPEEYDVQHEPITLYTPTLGKDQSIIDWATSRARAEQKIDENFIRFLPWLLNKPAKDMQVLDRQIDTIYKEYKRWSVEMYEFMEDVIRNVTINPSERLRVTCPNCGQEATSTVRFPNGIKVLFKVETKAKKFGSR